jgi:hypothetical protein
MEDGASGQTPASATYPQAGAWFAASQVRCVSAPWTSIAGGASLAVVQGYVEPHALTVTLQRVTPAGVVTLASEELNGLGAPRDELDGLAGSPFAGNIAAAYGTQVFVAGEVWPKLFPGALGRPDRFAAGQGYIAYQLAGTPGIKRSFQLVYNLTAAELGSELRCVVSAQDGPLQAPTTATFTSTEYAVSANRSCAPRRLASTGGPQPAVVLIGLRPCLNAPGGLTEIGGSTPGVQVLAGRAAVQLECAVSSCAGSLTLAGGGRSLAAVKLSLHHGGHRLVTLALSARGRSLLRRAGAAGLPASLTLAGQGTSRRLLSLRLISAP